MTYRQRRGRDVFHFHKNCRTFSTHLPDDKVLVLPAGERPKGAELCNACKSYERRQAEVKAAARLPRYRVVRGK